MDLDTLKGLYAETVDVSHKGHVYTLRAPPTGKAMAIVKRFSDEVSDLPEGGDGKEQYVGAMAEAVELTLDVDGPFPPGLALRIVLGSGGLQSPIGLAAARICGLPVVEGPAEVPDDLPT